MIFFLYLNLWFIWNYTFYGMRWRFSFLFPTIIYEITYLPHFYCILNPHVYFSPYPGHTATQHTDTTNTAHDILEKQDV